MESTPNGVSLDVGEVFACDITPEDIPHHVLFEEIPGLVDGITRRIEMMKSSHEILVRGREDGSRVVTDKDVEKSEDKIIASGVVRDGLIRAFDASVLNS